MYHYYYKLTVSLDYVFSFFFLPGLPLSSFRTASTWCSIANPAKKRSDELTKIGVDSLSLSLYPQMATTCSKISKRAYPTVVGSAFIVGATKQISIHVDVAALDSLLSAFLQRTHLLLT